MKQRTGLSRNTSTSLATRLGFTILGTIFVVAGIMLFINGTNTAILPNQELAIGNSLQNNPGKLWRNEGIIYFRKSIINYGDMNCGSCLSGANYFDNEEGEEQSIEGTQEIEMYDLVLDNPIGLVLENGVEVVNSLSFVQGNIRTERSDPDLYLHFRSGSVASGFSESKHIDGYAAKTGSGSFLLPIGDGTRFMPLGINGSDTSAFFKAAFFSLDPGIATLPVGAPFDTEAKEEGVLAVHTEEYWDVQGGDPSSITLYWDTYSRMEQLLESVTQVTVLGWDGLQWVDLERVSFQGDLNNGSVSSSVVIPDLYDAFTLGKKETTDLLPVEWLDFKVRLENDQALLDWATATEINSDFYAIEKSASGTDFQKIGTVKAAGTSSEVSTYSWTDPSPAVGGANRVYYRLAQYDLDGSLDYSKILQLALEGLEQQVKLNVFPNPAKDYAKIILRSPESGVHAFRVVDIKGQMVFQGQLQSGQEAELPVSSWAKGIYIVSVEFQGKALSKKLIVK